METFSALLALCARNSPVPVNSPRPVTRSFDVFFDLRLIKRLSKQAWGWWFETPAWSLWRQCNVSIRFGPKQKNRQRNEPLVVFKKDTTIDDNRDTSIHTYYRSENKAQATQLRRLGCIFWAVRSLTVKVNFIETESILSVQNQSYLMIYLCVTEWYFVFTQPILLTQGAFCYIAYDFICPTKWYLDTEVDTHMAPVIFSPSI